MTSCTGDDDSTTWCCGGGNTTCCGQAGAITIAATLGLSFTSSSTVLSTTSSSSTALLTTSSSSTIILTTSPTALDSASTTSTSDGTTLSIGAWAGIGVGISLASFAILGGIIWFVLRISRRRDVDRSGLDIYFRKPDLDGNSRGGWGGEDAANMRPRHELDGATRLEFLSELSTD